MSDPVQADAGALAALRELATQARNALNADAQTLGLERARAALLSKVGLQLCGDYLRACNPELILALVQDAERLDWLEQRAKAEGVALGWSHADHDYDEFSDRQITWPETFWVNDECAEVPHATLRNAIDAARAAQPDDDDHGEAMREREANRLYEEHERRAGRSVPSTEPTDA